LEKKKKNKIDMSFEYALKELEEIARRLEGGNLGLDESISEFERGVHLSKFCHDKLEEAERKIEILQKGEDNIIRKKEIKVKKDTGEVDDDEVQGNLL
jgi:exodeoxyribonuclease VII small subunit